MTDVFFYVQHLLGIGHFRRSVAIANSLARRGVSVQLASGGKPVAKPGNLNFEITQLPPVRARDGDFSDLVDEFDQPVDEKWWQHRQTCLMQAWQRSRAPVLMTESYPFARRMMRRELLPLLDESRKVDFAKLNICSVRDLPQPKRKPARVAEVFQILNQYYDQVLVHGDKSIATLEETFPDIASNCPALSLHYTGYVDTNNAVVQPSQTASDVLVSAGGGAAGLELYRAAVGAAKKDPEHLWRLLIGPNISEKDYTALLSTASDNVVVERNRSDFRELLMAATVSLSQAGYNTLVDVLRTGVASVLVPYSQGNEEEQTIRARKFSDRGRVVVLNESTLDPVSVLAAIDKARAQSGFADGSLQSLESSTKSPLNTEGADRSAELVAQWLKNG